MAYITIAVVRVLVFIMYQSGVFFFPMRAGRARNGGGGEVLFQALCLRIVVRTQTA